MKKTISIVTAICCILLMFCSCKNNEEIKTDAVHTKVKFTMKDGGTFTVEVYPEYAPDTCKNFVKLASEGFYNGLTFHRIIDDFMAQGGCFDSEGNPHNAESIRGEFKNNGFAQNTLSHERGVISMARTTEPNSASSQFFICYSDNYRTSLDGNYAAFGKVIEGMETIDAFLNVERTYNSSGELASPTTPIVIQSTEVLADV